MDVIPKRRSRRGTCCRPAAPILPANSRACP